MNTPRLLALGFGVLACVAVVLAVLSAGGPDKMASSVAGMTAGKAAEASRQQQDLTRNNARGQEGAVQTQVGSSSAAASAALPPDAPVEQHLAAIEQASISYDPKELPRIKPYLLHPDPEVRAAALNGILVLGDAAGAPLLREAAKQAATPQEAVKLLETADYLELPSASLLPRRKKGPSAPGDASSQKKSMLRPGDLPPRPASVAPAASQPKNP